MLWDICIDAMILQLAHDFDLTDAEMAAVQLSLRHTTLIGPQNMVDAIRDQIKLVKSRRPLVISESEWVGGA